MAVVGERRGARTRVHGGPRPKAVHLDVFPHPRWPKGIDFKARIADSSLEEGA